MEYVMVPVPEAIVDEVRFFLDWHVGQSREPDPDNPEAMLALFRDADATTRTLLRFVASESLEARRPTFGDVADAVGVSHRELHGLATEINVRFRRLGGGTAAFLLRQAPGIDPATLPADEDPWVHHLFFMPDRIAKQIDGA